MTEEIFIGNTAAAPLFDEEEIEEATEEAVKYFNKNFKGCTLTEISYAGDEISLKYTEWAVRYNADEVLVLTSAFEVGPDCEDGSLNPDSTYTDWLWIMVKDNNGWRHADHGY